MVTSSKRRCSSVTEQQLRLAFAVSLGGMLELYDFLIYAMMASYIADSFFPSADSMIGLLGTFSAFAVGYLSRPLGGIFFGHLGDRYGRKKTFTLSITTMAVSTALIGCLPTYDDVVILAPALLVVLRLIQGFSLGGEVPGAVTYLSESAPERSGFLLGILFMSLILGLSLATFVHGVLTLFLSQDVMMAWGWRIPFWSGGILGGFSYYIRRRFHESGLFLALDQMRQQQLIPLQLLLCRHRKGFICGLGIIAVFGSTVTILGVYMPGYLSSLHGYSRADVAWHASLAYVMLAPCCLLLGLVNDRFSHKLLFLYSILLISGVSLPYFQYINSETADLSKIMLVAAILSTLATGLLPSMLVRLFPTEVRYTGVATTYNFGIALFGGLAPVSTTLMIKYSTVEAGPALYLILLSCISLLVLFIPWPDYSMAKVENDSQ